MTDKAPAFIKSGHKHGRVFVRIVDGNKALMVPMSVGEALRFAEQLRADAFAAKKRTGKLAVYSEVRTRD